MGRLLRTSDARYDLTAIWLHIANDNLPAAERFLDRVDDTLERILQNPFMGEAVDYLRPGARRFIVGNYLLFYERIPDGVRLLRVYHAARPIEELIEEI